MPVVLVPAVRRDARRKLQIGGGAWRRVGARIPTPFGSETGGRKSSLVVPAVRDKGLGGNWIKGSPEKLAGDGRRWPEEKDGAGI